MKEYQKETIRDIIEMINKNILLPDIQRPFIWDEQQIYKLFDSLMRKYPINTFLFWELSREKLNEIKKKENFLIKMFRFVDSNNKDSIEETSLERETYKLVLDGQQRLTSLYIALKGTWLKKGRGAKQIQELYFNVLSGNSEDEDGIQYEFKFLDKNLGKAYCEKNSENSQVKLWVNIKRIFETDMSESERIWNFIDDILQNNTSLTDFKNKVFNSLFKFYNLIYTNKVINYFPETETDYEKVLDIFVRTNAGGTKLGYSDLLFSKIKLKWNDAREKFKDLLGDINTRRNFDFDNDLLLKTCLVLFASKSDEVRYNVTNLNSTLINKIEQNWDSITTAIHITFDLLEKFLITDKKQLPSHNALIPVVYWYFKKGKQAKTSEFNNKNEMTIRVWLIKALLSGVFSGQSDTTLYKCKEAIDLDISNNFPAEEIQRNINTMKSRSMDLKDDTFFDDISYKSKDSYLFLSLVYKMAITFKPFSKGNLPEQDHIFSKDELAKANIPKEKINCIFNIRYVSQDWNRKKSNTLYSEWVTELKDQKRNVLESHLIPEGDWNTENFYDFLKRRKELMLKQFEY